MDTNIEQTLEIVRKYSEQKTHSIFLLAIITDEDDRAAVLRNFSVHSSAQNKPERLFTTLSLAVERVYDVIVQVAGHFGLDPVETMDRVGKAIAMIAGDASTHESAANEKTGVRVKVEGNNTTH